MNDPGKASASSEYVDIVGEVVAADLRNGCFQVWLNDQTDITVQFTPDQEALVTQALKDHRTLRIHVKGKGDNFPNGKLQQIIRVDSLELQNTEATAVVPKAKPIWEIVEEITRDIPNEEWDKLPSDLSLNLDHYLYGCPKQ